ncbi:hypothetical protein FACS1894132_04250 [Clostridia bacterium]|nr:hypothetical protein FACS1894132_04250 [Clostridia bacterium]
MAMTIRRIIPTKEEGFVLKKAQGEFIRNGVTDIKCPRCGKNLVYEYGENWEMTHCSDIECISLVLRGI